MSAASTEHRASLEAAYATCEEIVRTQAKNFYYGLRLTPEPKRSAMYAIYAWMRQADDIADEAGHSREERAARLEAFGRATDAALDGNPSGSEPVWRALADVASRHQLVAKDFHDMLDGQRADLGSSTAPDAAGPGVVRCATWEELRQTCYRVASTVGLVCIRVWGYSDPKAIECAIDRGIAFQLTNILRDVREDYANGRIYLPLDEFVRFDLSPEALLEWPAPGGGDRTVAERCRAFMRFQIGRAESHYAASEPLDTLISPECQPTLWALTEIYHRLLYRIARDPRRAVLGERVRVPTWEKLWIGFRAKRRTLSLGTSRRGEPAGAATS